MTTSERLAVIHNLADGDCPRSNRVVGVTVTYDVGDSYEIDAILSQETAFYPFNGVPVAMKKNGTLYYLHRDHLGSLVSATDSSGTEQCSVRYAPFGAIRSSTGTLITDRLFTGQVRDWNSDGFYFFKARYYDATIGKFQTADSIPPEAGKPRALNRFAYALNNPMRFNDPTGHREASPNDDPDWTASPTTSDPTPAPDTASTTNNRGETTKHEWSANPMDAAAGAANGFGGGQQYAVAYQNKPTKSGQARLGVRNPKSKYGWDRSFHLDFPDKYHGYHINAEIGPLTKLNHVEIPKQLYGLGSTTALRTIGRTAVVAGVALDTYEIATASPHDRPRVIGGVVGGWVGAAAGAVAGTAVLPGVGTFVGGAAGGVAGSYIGEQIGELFE